MAESSNMRPPLTTSPPPFYSWDQGEKQSGCYMPAVTSACCMLHAAYISRAVKVSCSKGADLAVSGMANCYCIVVSTIIINNVNTVVDT